MNKINCTVEVLTHNSAATLARTLESLIEFGQVIVIDGNSTDATREIAMRFGCEIIDQDKSLQKKQNTIGDFAGIRNQGIARAKYCWFIFVDSDEVVTPELVQEIREITESKNRAAAFWVPRKYVLQGEVVERACTYPNRQMRFFHLDGVNGFVKKVHERIDVKPGTCIASLRHAMLVPVDLDREARRRKMRYYVQIEFDRQPAMSLGKYIRFASHHLGVSVLYLLRTLRNIFVGSGKILPFSYELDYHLYNLMLCKRFLGKIQF